MYKCISAVIRLKSPRSEVTKQVDWESVINLVFVYLRPAQQHKDPPPLNQDTIGIFEHAHNAHDCTQVFSSNIANKSYESQLLEYVGWPLDFFSTGRWDLRKANHQESIVRSNCVESNLVKSGEDEQRQLGLVAQKTSFHLDLLLAPDPKCFPTPSILKLPF